MDTQLLLFISLCILLFALISKRIQTTFITPPMIFVLFGVLLSKSVLGVFELDPESSIIHTIAEITLVLVLFTDASRIDLKLLKKDHSIPVRLLVKGLPLTIILGTLAAMVVFDTFSFWECAVLAAILAPTDAALGQAVVSSPKVPVRIRQSLNVESGLNDGIALPVVMITVFLASISTDHPSGNNWISFVAHQLILGPAVGIFTGYFGGRILSSLSHKGWVTHSFQDLSSLGFAILSFSLAEQIGGNGFISAFCAGLTLGNSSRHICTCLYEFAEAEGQLLTLFSFMLFGSVLIIPALGLINADIIIYSLLSLTVIRMLPVMISLLGKKLKPSTVLFLGWFGPRGLASILFGLLVLEQSHLVNEHVIFNTMIVTVFLSVFAHGITANPLSEAYSNLDFIKSKNKAHHENTDVSEMPVKF
jgi:NhaP-type Na+/H+ or K+/H+ antiporter